jgi:chemotaxis methyl-accepting protein methylase
MDEGALEPVDRGNLTRLLDKVRDDRGLDLAQYRPRYLERRIATRLLALGLVTYRQYAAYLDAHPEEYAKLLDALTIGVTQFFRDASVFGFFRDHIVPEIVERKADRHQSVIRAWSAGCATGEEAYSIAMSLLTATRNGSAQRLLVQVVGTDIDGAALDTARRAEYPIAQLEQIPEAERRAYVDVAGDRFRIRPEVTEHVRFEYLNLFEDRPARIVDVVFCRNVFIYFNREDQERMLSTFWERLVKGGYLVLGRSERLAPALAKHFEVVSVRERIYRKPTHPQ